jgi:uncharacterized protein YegL
MVSVRTTGRNEYPRTDQEMSMTRQDSALWPFYLVVDVSWSMSLAGKIEAADRMVSSIVDTLARDPVAATIRFGLVEFSDDARIRLPLGDIAAVKGGPPKFTARAGTSFQSAFTLLRDAIPKDLTRLAATRTRTIIRRPTVFLLTDGGPTDDEREWHSALTSLTALPARPKVVPCGVDAAPVGVLSRLAHPRNPRHHGTAYLMDPAYPPAQAISAFAEVVISSMLASCRRSDGRTMLPPVNRVPAGLTGHRITTRSPSTGSAGFPGPGDRGRMGRCRTDSSDARLNSRGCTVSSPERPTGNRQP